MAGTTILVRTIPIRISIIAAIITHLTIRTPVLIIDSHPPLKIIIRKTTQSAQHPTINSLSIIIDLIAVVFIDHLM